MAPASSVTGPAVQHWNPRRILITGASGGIGAALAHRLAGPGRHLFLCGRDAARLDAVARACTAAGALVDTAAFDIRDAARLRAFVATSAAELAVANAGISGRSGGGSRSAEIVAVNLQSVIDTVEAAWPAMQARSAGQIALMASLAGYRGMPSAPVYSTSKAAVIAYGQAMRPRAARAGIDLSVICPGFVDTAMTRANPFAMPLLMTPDRAAAIIVAGLARRRRLIAFPWRLALAARLLAALPDRLAERLLADLPTKE